MSLSLEAWTAYITVTPINIGLGKRYCSGCKVGWYEKTHQEVGVHHLHQEGSCAYQAQAGNQVGGISTRGRGGSSRALISTAGGRFGEVD